MNKITVISGYYYPEDTAIGLYNTQMVEFLKDKGYDVTIVTGFPSYPHWKIKDSYREKKTFLIENHNQSKIYRYKQYVPSSPTFFKRILLIIDFTFGSFFNILKIKECDVVISVVPHTSTMLLGWLLKFRTNAKLWNHIQDFEFDAAKETGVYLKVGGVKGALFNLLFKIERKLLNQGNVNSTISYNMLDKLKVKSTSNSYYFPNWIDSNKIDPGKSICHNFMKTDKFKILYSGNIGDKQDWDFFLLFVSKLESFNVEIIVVGDGAKREWLCNELKNFKNVKYYQPIKYDELSNLLCNADLHVLFQKNNVIDSVMPSKLLGMMASAKPSLIIGSNESEVKTIIEESEGGYYIFDKDIEKCVSVVKNLIESPQVGSKMGKRARNYVIENFSSQKVLLDFEKKLSQLINN